MEILPPSLSYAASKQALRINRFQVRPSGSDDATPGSTFRINLPSKSLVNMSSFNLCFNLTLSGLTAHDVNFSQAKLPHGHKLFSAVRVYVGGQLVSGGLSNHYDILHNCLVKASAGEDWCRSRYNEHAKELIENSDDVGLLATNLAASGATTKQARYVISDFLGIFRGNGSKSIIDTSLWGDVSIEFTMNSAACIAKFAAGTKLAAGLVVDNITYSIANIEGYVELITNTTPLYIKLITMLLDSKEQQIRFPYQNFVTGITSSGKNARLQINSGCIDAMVCVPLNANFNSLTAAVTAGDLSAQRYKYTAINTAGNAMTVTNDGNAFTGTTTNMQIQIGSDTFPKVPIQSALDVSDITMNALFSNSLYSQNLLFAGSASYSRQQFLTGSIIF